MKRCYIYSGDDEEVRIWEVTEFQHFQTLIDNNQRWGQITTIKFINRDTGMEWICFGTGRGHLLVYHRGRKSVSELTFYLFFFSYIPRSRDSRSISTKKSSARKIALKASPSTLRLRKSPSRAIMDGFKSSASRMGSLLNFGMIHSLM